MAALRPQITTTINQLTSLVAPSGAKTIAIIGTAQYGPIDTIVSVDSMAQAIEIFKEDITSEDITLIKGLDLAYANGAGSVKIVRIEDGTADFASNTFDGNTGAEADVLTFNAYYKGSFGNNISITITANANTPANRDLLLTDGVNIEVFNNNGAGYSTNQAIVDAINGTSRLVTVSVKAGSETTNIVDAVTATFLLSGSNGASVITSDYTDALSNILYTEDFTYLLIPGNSDDSFQGTITGILDTRASDESRYSRYLTGVSKDETISTIQTRTASGARLSLVSPSVKYTNRVTGSQEILDGSYLACAVGGKKSSIDLQASGTNQILTINGISINSTLGVENYSKAEQETLLQSRVVPVAIVNNAYRIVRDITRVTDTSSVFFEASIVDVTDDITATMQAFLQNALGKENTEPIRIGYADRMDNFLIDYFEDGIINGYQSTVVNQGATPDSIVAQVSFQPIFATNFISLTINVG